MKFCRFGVFNMKTIFPSLIPVFSCIRMISRINLVDKKIESYPLFICLVMLLGEIVGGCFNFVFVVQEIKEDIEKNNNTMSIPEPINGFVPILTKSDLLAKIKIYMILFGLASIESISTIAYFGISTNYKDLVNIEFNMKSTQILFTLIFSSFILMHYPIYKHQSVAIGFILIGIILVTVMPLIEKDNAWKVVLFWICYFFLWSIKEVVEKILIEKYFLKPLFIIFTEGLMGMAIVLFFVFCCWAAGTETIISIPTSIAVWEAPYDGDAFGITVGYLIGNIGLYVCLILTNKFYTPVTKTVADSISNVLWWIISVLFLGEWDGQKHTDLEKGMSVIGYVLICFGCVMFNEVIIFYFCDLQDNTRLEIINRGKEDFTRETMVSMPMAEVCDTEALIIMD